MLIRWPVCALIAAGAASNLLEQAALHVGPLSVSQPILVIIYPFASIILSVWLFGERFTDNPAKITIAVLSFAALAAAVTTLTRTAPQDLSPARPARP
jgi:branched-subunit amino acid permease